jgi:hypothetical protein
MQPGISALYGGAEMFGFGKPRFPVDADEVDWLVACFAWLSREFSKAGPLTARPTILPDEHLLERMPQRDAALTIGIARALELFEQTKAHAGMQDWPCELRAGDADRERSIALGHALKHHRSAPLGTFGYADDGYVITYNPTSLAHPQTLVATFAHELAHFLLHTAKSPPPGGKALAEHATDVGAAYLGFGVFMANSAKNFSQFQSAGEIGWEMRGAGYLSENALTTALAMMVRLTAANAVPIERELKTYLRGVFRKALAAADLAYPDLPAALEAVDLNEWA